jgi:hypothetical protein
MTESTGRSETIASASRRRPSRPDGEDGPGTKIVTLSDTGRRRAGLGFVEKVLTRSSSIQHHLSLHTLTSTDTTERNASMLRPGPARRIAGRAGYRSWLLVVLVVVAHRRLAPSSSATTSMVDPALGSPR